MARRLAAILAADVVGFSRLMGADETGTLERLKTLRKELVQPKVTAHGGRIVKLMGDGLLAEFPSVVEAVQCASDIQRAMAEGEPEIPDDRRIRLRIGINLGDIIVEGSDIYGDGVNVAARLEGLADPGGICISGPAFDAVDGKLDLAFENVGEQQVKNIAKLVRIYRLASGRPQAGSPIHLTGPLPLSNKPSIAVLPFVNMSGDPEQVYFCDGITEDVITELSRFGALEVVARHSTFIFRDQAVDWVQAAKILGVRYLLEGSLRKSGNRLRLTAQLLDVETGKHIWAERYDRELEDIFAIQDELVQAIVATLAGRLVFADTERSLRKPPESLAAYDYYLRALQFDRKYDAESALEGHKVLEKAVALDPTFAKAHALLAIFTLYSSWFEGGDQHAHDDKALVIARKAIELDPDDGYCYSILAIVHLHRGEFKQAQHCFEKALGLNPNDISIWSDYAWYLSRVGEQQKALDRLDQRESLEPYPPNWHHEVRGQALYGLGRFSEAVDSFHRMTVTNPWDHALLAACYGQLGELDQARKHLEAYQKEVPEASLRTFAKNEKYFQHPEDLELWLEGLRKAGLSE